MDGMMQVSSNHTSVSDNLNRISQAWLASEEEPDNQEPLDMVIDRKDNRKSVIIENYQTKEELKEAPTNLSEDGETRKSPTVSSGQLSSDTAKQRRKLFKKEIVRGSMHMPQNNSVVMEMEINQDNEDEEDPYGK